MNTKTKFGAIETEYKGYRFRSRLEARWAVFFDAIEYEWEYEPQGYEKTSEGGVVRYLPDFRVRGDVSAEWVWVEVKGELSEDDTERMTTFLSGGCPMPGFDESCGLPHRGLLMLGDIPEPIHGIVLHRSIQHVGDTLVASWAQFEPSAPKFLRKPVTSAYLKFHTKREEAAVSFMPSRTPVKEALELMAPRAISIKSHFAFPILKEAYAAARSARFEHGEKA